MSVRLDAVVTILVFCLMVIPLSPSLAVILLAFWLLATYLFENKDCAAEALDWSFTAGIACLAVFYAVATVVAIKGAG